MRIHYEFIIFTLERSFLDFEVKINVPSLNDTLLEAERVITIIILEITIENFRGQMKLKITTLKILTDSLEQKYQADSAVSVNSLIQNSPLRLMISS